MNNLATTKAMILAAGRGERMRPLTDGTPKPLLLVHGKPLMQWPLEALAVGGFTDRVVNTAWLGEQIERHFGPSLTYSHEGRDFGGALETAGGVVRALPLLGDIFWVAAGDVYVPDFRFTQDAVARFQASDMLAHLWLVPNPAHNLRGDFGISDDGRALSDAAQKYTFSTIALYRAALFRAAVVRHSRRKSAGRESRLGAAAARRDGRRTRQRRTLHRRVDRRRHAGAACAVERSVKTARLRREGAVALRQRAGRLSFPPIIAREATH